MLEQVSTSVKFLAFFTASKQGKTGLTVTIDIYNPSGTQIVTAGSATALGGGLYSYTLTSNNSSEGEYAAIFKTSDSTVDAQHIPSLWVLGRAGVENLDAATSTRLPSSSYTAPANSDITAIKAKTDNIPASPAAVSDIPTTAQIATAVEGSLLNEADGQAVLNAIVGAIGNTNLSEVSLVAAVRADLERVGGKIDSIPTDSAPSAASVASAVWSASTKEITGGTVTTLTNSPDVPTESEIAAQVRTELSVELGRIDAAISSRLAPSGTLATVTTLTNAPTVPSAAAIADEVRVELATELARLDAPVSGATAPSAATVATAVRSELSVELARVDQAVSTRLAGSAYTAPANSDITAIKAKTDALNTERLANVATTAIVGNLLAQANS
jgi:hypothetical protein